jgi:predicted DCC family thiol-disulfide oxidoreductase YuxK
MNFDDGNAWIFYDGQCRFCRGGAQRFMRILVRHNIGLMPLQDAAVRQRVGLLPGEPLTEMKMLTRTGQLLGGAACFAYIFRIIWWTYPLYLLINVPGLHCLFSKFYIWFARNRHCIGGTCMVSAAGAPTFVPERRAP